MNRLQSQLQRLYGSGPIGRLDGDRETSSPSGQDRAMVLELARPADWELLSKVWRGVQADLSLPPPAIAVSGIDGVQLWFSLEQPVDADHARAFLKALCSRYLPDVGSGRLRLTSTVEIATSPALHRLPAIKGPTVPALQAQTGFWSAFVTADLAPIFADTPWVESAPSDDGQASVLSHLVSITRPALDTALERLGLAPLPTDAPATMVPTDPADPAPARPGAAHQSLDPRQFLLQVMNDDRVALALRVEAAKALLPGYPDSD